MTTAFPIRYLDSKSKPSQKRFCFWKSISKFEFPKKRKTELFWCEMEKINEIYRKTFLFSGFFDGETVVYNRKRHFFNLFMDAMSHLFFGFHLVVFLADNEQLNRNLVYLHLTKGFAQRFINLGGGFGLLFMNISVGLYRKYSENPHRFRFFRFLFCLDEQAMQEQFHLSERGAKRQVQFQRQFVPIMNAGFLLYSLVSASFVLYLFLDNLDASFGALFYAQLVLYLLLFLVLRSSVTRILLNCFEIILGTFYLTNRLNKLKTTNLGLSRHLSKNEQNATEQKSESQKHLQLQVLSVLNEYNEIVTAQKYMNLHADKSLTIFIVILVFSVVYPSLLLFDENQSIASIVFYVANYVCVLIFLYPITHFNERFLVENKRFVDSFSFIARFKSNPSTSLKILSVYTLNNRNQTLSFNFRSIFAFNMPFFAFVGIPL